jgi:hypothetical protein
MPYFYTLKVLRVPITLTLKTALLSGFSLRLELAVAYYSL